MCCAECRSAPPRRTEQDARLLIRWSAVRAAAAAAKINCYRGVRVMRPEISLLVELLARSVYERWKAGEPVPGTPSPPPQKQHDPVSEARDVADRPARGSSGGAFGCKLVQNVANGSGGVLPTNSTTVIQFPSADRRRKIPSTEIPNYCGHGHPLTLNNLRIDLGERRWRCRQCARKRSAAFRRRHQPVA
jgi:hypothetical protein